MISMYAITFEQAGNAYIYNLYNKNVGQQWAISHNVRAMVLMVWF